MTTRTTSLSFRTPLLMIALAIGLSAPAHADLQLKLQVPFAADPGSIGQHTPYNGNFLTVVLTNPDSIGYQIAGFNFEITSANPAITFTDANTETNFPAYIFAGNSLADLLTWDLAIFHGSSLLAADIATNGIGTTLGPNETMGLGHVFFDVAPDAHAGNYPVTFVTTSIADTSIGDPSAHNLAFTAVGGQITVTPEPAAIVLLGSVSLLCCVKLRRRLTGI